MTRRALTAPHDAEIARQQLTLPTGQPRPCPACDGNGHHGPEHDPVPCPTWERAGGTGHAYQWSPREQLYRAFVIWDKQDGVEGNGRGDWSEWGTAGKCGLR